MPHQLSAIGEENGFSLIELLIVLVIIGIILSFAILAVGDFGQGRRTQATAESLSQTISLVEQQAILANKTYALQINENGYRFYQWDKDKHNHWHWQLVEDNKLLAFHTWPKKIKIRLQKQDNAATANQANLILIDVQGNLSAFTLGFYYHNRLITHLIGHGNGKLQLQNKIKG